MQIKDNECSCSLSEQLLRQLLFDTLAHHVRANLHRQIISRLKYGNEIC